MENSTLRPYVGRSYSSNGQDIRSVPSTQAASLASVAARIISSPRALIRGVPPSISAVSPATTTVAGVKSNMPDVSATVAG
jgi:hypothetical protein